MTFQIVEIVEAKPERIVAKVSHQNHQLTVIVPGRRQDDIPVDRSFQAEIGFDRVLDWKSIDDFEDAKSGIWQDQDGIHLLGRVHNVLDYGDGKTVIDVYVQNGSELFTVDSETIEDVPEANDGLEITVDNLYLYPTDD